MIGDDFPLKTDVLVDLSEMTKRRRLSFRKCFFGRATVETAYRLQNSYHINR